MSSKSRTPIRRWALAGVAAGTLLTLAACGGDKAPAAAGHKAASTASQAGSSGQEWQSDVVPDGDPVAAGDVVAAVVRRDDSNGKPSTDLVGVDATTGKQMWKTPLPISDGGRMVFDDPNQSMRLTSPKKPVSLSGGVAQDGAPVVVADYQVVTQTVGLSQGGTVGHLVAFDATTGKVLWDQTAPAQPMLFMGGPQQSVVLFGAITPPDSSTEKIPVTAIDLLTGRQVWSYTGEALPYAVTGTDLVMINQNLDKSAILALDVNTGQQEWSTPAWTHVNAQNWLDYEVANVGNGTVLAWKDWDPDPNSDHQHTALLLDAHTGATIGTIATDGHSLKTGTATANSLDQTRPHADPNDQGMKPPTAGVLDPDAKAAYFIDWTSDTHASLRLVALNPEGGWTITVPGSPSTEVLSAGNGQVLLRNNGLVTLDATSGKQVGGVAADPNPNAEVGTNDGQPEPGVVLRAGGYWISSNNGALQGMPASK